METQRCLNKRTCTQPDTGEALWGRVSRPFASFSWSQSASRVCNYCGIICWEIFTLFWLSFGWLPFPRSLHSLCCLRYAALPHPVEGCQCKGHFLKQALLDHTPPPSPNALSIRSASFRAVSTLHNHCVDCLMSIGFCSVSPVRLQAP